MHGTVSLYSINPEQEEGDSGGDAYKLGREMQECNFCELSSKLRWAFCLLLIRASVSKLNKLTSCQSRLGWNYPFALLSGPSLA